MSGCIFAMTHCQHTEHDDEFHRNIFCMNQIWQRQKSSSVLGLENFIKFLFQPSQCCGSMTSWCGSGSGSADPCLLTNGSGSGCGSGSFYFQHWPSRCQQITNLNKKFFCILLFESTFTSFFKGKKKVSKQ